jgi:hypothetical protein
VKNYKYLLPVACAAAILCGCATSLAPKLENIVIPDGAQQKKFTIMKLTPSSKNIRRDQIVDAVIRSLRTELGSAPELRYVATENTIALAYRQNMGINHANLVADYKFAIEEDGSNYLVTLQCPAVMHSDILDISLTGMGGWNKEQIAKKISASCNSASISIPFADGIRSEVNIPFNDISTFSNFRRHLRSGKDAWSAYAKDEEVTALDIAKSEKFYAPAPYGDTLVSVAVYPYRNGSKVVYAFVYRYSITGSGTTYNANSIKEIKKAIVSVAND